VPVIEPPADGVFLPMQGIVANDGGVTLFGVRHHRLYSPLAKLHLIARPEDTGRAHLFLNMNISISEGIMLSH